MLDSIGFGLSAEDLELQFQEMQAPRAREIATGVLEPCADVKKCAGKEENHQAFFLS